MLNDPIPLLSWTPSNEHGDASLGLGDAAADDDTGDGVFAGECTVPRCLPWFMGDLPQSSRRSAT